jgi:hypothetical protein
LPPSPQAIYNPTKDKEKLNKLLSAPDQYMTPLQGSKLWHLALLEMWLQIHVDSPGLQE